MGRRGMDGDDGIVWFLRAAREDLASIVILWIRAPSYGGVARKTRSGHRWYRPAMHSRQFRHGVPGSIATRSPTVTLVTSAVPMMPLPLPIRHLCTGLVGCAVMVTS